MASSYRPAPATPTPRDPTARREGESDLRAIFHVSPEIAPERTLSRMIEAEIIPRMMAAHTRLSDRFVAGDHHADTISAEEIAAFAPMALAVEADELLSYAEALIARGVSVETLLVDLLAPAARELGAYWEADRCNFVDVTMGLWRLQEVLHEVAARAPTSRARPGPRRALFASMPGDQHSFGTVVIDELFARDGWLTDRMSEATTADLTERVADEWFDLVGLTVSCDCHIGALPQVVAGVRKASRNSRLCVMLGGRVLVNDPALAQTAGADGTARDARVALIVADTLVGAAGQGALSQQ